ncbi:hypothetical protein ASPCAL07789 [Aspergillus calidoustus]|uniref:F-box domain-containing protein n=1 Tax=Aspergillus calidoustus TaxID=454130 RepID=A0A0U5GNF3_ASPCI|nr:hypothetical protein ASPCAL07789 [Aspergillus calidoustus]
MDITRACTTAHSPVRGLRVPAGLAESTIEQTASLTKLPVELILTIFDALTSDPIAQITLAMTCRKMLAVSSTATIRACCLPPGSVHRGLLLCYIHPRTTDASSRTSSTLCTVTSSDTNTLAVPPAWYKIEVSTANLSPEWHICGPCGKLRPTRANYWEERRRQHDFVSGCGYEPIWHRAAAQFCMKRGGPHTKCPECEVAAFGGLRRGVPGRRAPAGGFQNLTWRDCRARGS